MSARLYSAVAMLATVALASCQRNSLCIEGDIQNLPDGPMTLSVLDSTLHWTPVDTTEAVGGKFTFNAGLEFDQPECLILSIGSQNMVVFAGNDNIKMSGNALRPEDINVSGSKANKKLVAFAQNIPGKERLAQIKAQMATLAADVDRREELAEEEQAIEAAQLDYIRKSIADNVASPIGPYILFNTLSLFTYDEVEAYYAIFKANQPTHKYVDYLRAELDRTRPLNEARKRIQVGRFAPDFVIRVEGGDTLRLSSLRGDIVLLDFWASWNEMSRKNNETILAVFNKFQQVGISVVGVSIDSHPEDWQAAVQADNLPGHQIIDDGSIAELYGVTSLPASFLIDKSGRIVSSDIVAKIFENLGRDSSKK